MRVLITGAGGFIGRGLTAAVLAGGLNAQGIEELVLVDGDLSKLPVNENDNLSTTRIQGSIGDNPVLEQVFARPVDVVFHLAGITSGAAQENLDLGLAVNVQATMTLLDALNQPRQKAAPPPRLIFASSIAVFGAPLPASVNDDTPPEPILSYGCQKRMMELLIADYARRGVVDGRSIRFSGVIARPAQKQGVQKAALSAFSSDILRELAANRPWVCPVSKDATSWLVSHFCAVTQLLVAAKIPAGQWPASRAVTLPALRVTMSELVAALERYLGQKRAHLVQWAPDPELEAQFGRWPVLATETADKLGFRHDGSVDALVTQALSEHGV